MHKQSLRERAIALRNDGHSYAYISSTTGLSKSTLSNWLGRIPYTPNKETVERIGKAIAAANARKTAIKLENISAIRKQAAEDIGHIGNRDLFMLGLGLYVGEGCKTNDITRIVNADPQVINLAIQWFRSLGVVTEQFSIRVHTYPDNDVDEDIQYWSQTTGIPASQFSKTQIDRRKDKVVQKAGKLPHGTAHLSVRSLGRKEFGVILARKIQAWTDEVSRTVITRD